MSTQELKELRAALGCSLGELADAIGVDVKTLLAWESGELFPTKKHEDRLAALKAAGPSAIVRRPRGKTGKGGVDLLAEPRLWAIVRKLLAHPELFTAVEKLSERYDDPSAKS